MDPTDDEVSRARWSQADAVRAMRAHYSHEHPTRENADADGQVWSDLGRFAGQVRAAVRRGPGLVAGTQ